MSVQKFIDAQADGPSIGTGATWREAINQLRRTGFKGSLHYAWYIFPQLAGVTLMATGNDPTAISQYYAINNLEQAVAYLRNADLRTHLMIFATEMARIAPHRSIGGILGIGDANKFKSSMTLFLIAAIILRDDTALTSFRNALLRFGAPRLYDNLDPVTLTILREQNSPLLARVPRGVFSIIVSGEDGAAAHDSGGGGGGGGGAPAPAAAADSFYTPPWSPSESPQGQRAPAGFDEDAAQEELIDAFDMEEKGSLIDHMVAMGFSGHEAAMALARAEPPGDIQAAVQLIFDERAAGGGGAAAQPAGGGADGVFPVPSAPPLPDDGGGDAAADGGGDPITSLTDPIIAMGFSRRAALQALAETPRANQREHIAAAIEWLLARKRRRRRRRNFDTSKTAREKKAKKWPKVQTGQGRRTRRRRRRRRKPHTKKRRQRRRRRQRRKTRRRNK